jgi:hypothetical protein
VPHTGFIEENLSPGDEAKARARLHIQGGWDRFETGEIADAIAAFYDAFVSAMWRYFVSDEFKTSLDISQEDNLADDQTLFEILKRSEIIDTSFTQSDYDFITDLLDDALEDRDIIFDDNKFRIKFENVMHQLGILPL